MFADVMSLPPQILLHDVACSIYIFNVIIQLLIYRSLGFVSCSQVTVKVFGSLVCLIFGLYLIDLS